MFVICLCFFEILDITIGSLIRHLPDPICYIVLELIRSIFAIFCLVASIGIIVHIFKARYLDYYEKIKSNSLDINNEKDLEIEDKNDENKIEKNNKILFKRNENKIIIRDPKYSEYRFIHSILKILVIGIKFFALLMLGVLCVFLIGLFAGFIASFAIYKTGILFIGLLLSFLSIGIANIIIILLLLNFIFNRKNDKKKMIWSFIASLIVLGIGIGLIFLGCLKFHYIDSKQNKDEMANSIFKITMEENTNIEYYYDKIEYLEKDINNIEIEVKTNKLFSVDYYILADGTIYLNTSIPNYKNVFDYVINNLNNYKVVELDSSIYEIKIYASKSNIKKLKDNYKKKIEKGNDETNIYN